MKRLYARILTGGLIALSLLAGSAAQAQSYTVTPLGTPAGSTWSQPAAINEQGEVVGEAYYTNQGTRPFIYLPAAAHGLAKGIHALPRPGDSAWDINDAGQVVGGGPDPLGHAFLWESGVTTELTSYSGPDGVSPASLGWRLDQAVAINESGQVICRGQSGPRVPYSSVLWVRDAAGNVSITPLPSTANGLNDSGHTLTAAMSPATGAKEQCLYDALAGTVLAFIGPLFGQSGWALNNYDESINQTGYLYLPFPNYGRPAGVSWLGSLGGNTTYSRGINDGGMVVGYSTDRKGTYRAFRWLNGSMVDLNSVSSVGRDWVLTHAKGVSNSGRIIGYGTYKKALAGYVLTTQ